MDKTISIRLSKFVKDEVKKAAVKKGISPSQYVRSVLYRALKLRLKDLNYNKISTL